MTEHTDIELITQHIEKNVGKVHQVFHEVISDDLHIDVCHVKSSLFRRYEVLVTMGMSAKAMEVPVESEEPRFLELMILLPKGWPLTKEAFMDENNYWPIRLLKDLARFVHHQNTWFGFGHTVANAEPEGELSPYADNVGFCACALLPSLTLGEPSLILQREPEKGDIGFFSVIPIYESELRFKFEHGIDALLDVFDAGNLSDRVNPKRKPVIA